MWISHWLKSAAVQKIRVRLLKALGEFSKQVWSEDWGLFDDVEGVPGLRAGVPTLDREKPVVLQLPQGLLQLLGPPPGREQFSPWGCPQTPSKAVRAALSV
jgi:hypothetical protein